jgi:hypothetical protein
MINNDRNNMKRVYVVQDKDSGDIQDVFLNKKEDAISAANSAEFIDGDWYYRKGCIIREFHVEEE